jgi:hypothetical protein
MILHENFEEYAPETFKDKSSDGDNKVFLPMHLLFSQNAGIIGRKK